VHKLLLAAISAVLFSHAVLAQVSLIIPNDIATGTTVGKLAKEIPASTNPPCPASTTCSTAIITATTDISGIAGVVVGTIGAVTGACPSGNCAIVAQSGKATCIIDAGGATAGVGLVNSTATAGDCMSNVGHPTMEVIGNALSTVASGPVDMQVIVRRPAAVIALTPITVSAAGNIDLSLTSPVTVCGSGINYTGATGTLTILWTAAPGCKVVVTAVTNLVTIATAAGSLQTACTTPRTRAAGSAIELWVLSNSGSSPITAVYGDCG
jgi:hypothetical protein